MKKTLVALAVLGLYAGVAQAQSNVAVYGIVDTGYIKETGRDLRQGERLNNRIGLRGVEDLGNGLKANFELQKRFDLNDGSLNSTNTASYRGTKPANDKQWDGSAAVGLQGGFGQVRIGRVWETTTQTITRFDPFEQSGIGSWFYGIQRARSTDNTARYDSPNWNGFSFAATYSLGQNTKQVNTTGANSKDWDNDGYSINLSYKNGPFDSTANWSRIADSDNSYTWNIGLGYKFLNQARVTLAYEDAHSNGYKGSNSGTSYSGRLDARQRNLLLGLEWDVGPGQFLASVQWDRVKSHAGPVSTAAGYTYSANPLGNRKGDNQDAIKYALGYNYNLSKRTTIYGHATYTDYDSRELGNYWVGLDRESVTAFQLGITHKF
ncbi:MAG: porin [Burkholderiaceae bacterium]|jgi:predicted porin|nr:porin [Burkholderiaceae bacterium]